MTADLVAGAAVAAVAALTLREI